MFIKTNQGVVIMDDKPLRIYQSSIEALAKLINGMLDDGHYSLNFYSFTDPNGQEIIADKMYPALNHPQTVNFFFFLCAQQFGF